MQEFKNTKISVHKRDLYVDNIDNVDNIYNVDNIAKTLVELFKSDI